MRLDDENRLLDQALLRRVSHLVSVSETMITLHWTAQPLKMEASGYIDSRLRDER
jgi:hypothetical protein